MSDTTKRTGAAGLPPSNLLAGNQYNPHVGAGVTHLVSYPPGTPVVQSQIADNTIVPGRANNAATSQLTGLTAVPAVVGSQAVTQFAGVLTLTTDQWDAITGDTGGLVLNTPYYLSTGFQEGHLTQTPPVGAGFFVARVGVALSPTDLLIQLCAPTVAPLA